MCGSEAALAHSLISQISDKMQKNPQSILSFILAVSKTILTLFGTLWSPQTTLWKSIIHHKEEQKEQHYQTHSDFLVCVRGFGSLKHFF